MLVPHIQLTRFPCITQRGQKGRGTLLEKVDRPEARPIRLERPLQLLGIERTYRVEQFGRIPGLDLRFAAEAGDDPWQRRRNAWS